MYVKTTNKIAYWKNPYFQRKNRSNRTKSSDPNDAAVYMGDMSCHIFNCPSCMKGNFRDCDSIKSGFIGPWVRFEFGVDFTRGSKRSREWTYFWKLTKITKNIDFSKFDKSAGIGRNHDFCPEMCSLGPEEHIYLESCIYIKISIHLDFVRFERFFRWKYGFFQ